jgi:thiol-disulfide isomerase/thioredoxin
MKRFVVLILLLGIASAATAAGFTLKDSTGKTHTLNQYKGRWVLVNFWATWCPPCLKEIPDFVSLYEAHKGKDFAALGVAVDYQDPKEVTDYVKKLAMSYPLIMGDDTITAQFGDLVGLPVSFLYDPQGKLVLKKIGTLPKETIEKYLAGQN